MISSFFDELIILLHEFIPVAKVSNSKTESQDLGSIARSNSLKSCPNNRLALVDLPLFGNTICLSVDVCSQSCSITNLQSARVINSVFIKLGKFIEHGLQVNHDSISKYVCALWIQDAAWQEMEGILDLVDNNSVTSV